MPVLLIDFLEKYNVPYVRRDIKSYGDSGSRISVPKDWEGKVIVVREEFDPSRVLKDMVDELELNLESCEKMRVMSVQLETIPCSKVIGEEIFDKVGRDNVICKKCPFGQKIEQLATAIDELQEDKETTKRKLAEQFFEEKVE